MRTVYGYDFRAEVCGVDGLVDKRFMYFPVADNLNFPLCVSACPYYYVRDFYCIYSPDYTTCMQDYEAYSTIETTTIGYYCVPGDSPARDNVLSRLYSPMWLLKRAAGEVKMAWSVILLGAILAVIVGIAHLALFRNPRTVKPLMIVSVLLSVGLLGVLAYFLYENYEKVRTKQAYSLLCDAYGPVQPSNCLLKGSQAYYVLCGLTSLAALWVSFRLYMDRSHLRISLGLLSITGRPLHSMSQFLLYPICHLISGLCVFTALITLYILTLGLQTIVTKQDESSPGGKSRVLEFKWTEEVLFVFICVMCALWIGFLSSLYRFVLSFAVATWYFCREKSQLYVNFYSGACFSSFKDLLSLSFRVLSVPRYA